MTRQQYHHGDLKNALIQAGVEILALEGVNGLTLRKVARQAGVSHSAPYAHFADKQALVAAISTAGYRQLAGRLAAVVEAYPHNPLDQLIHAAYTYLDFSVQEPAQFKTTFSGLVEKEADYPALGEMARQSFELLQGIIGRAQAAGLLDPGPAEVLGVALWSQVHGLACLVMEGQISHTVLEGHPIKMLLISGLQQFVKVPIDQHAYP